MAGERLPSFDLVVATVDRVAELERLLASLEVQTHRAFRVLLVDQNEDDRLEPILPEQRPFDLVRLRSERGLSRARNAALGEVKADLVAFPDDDCVFAPELLEQVARRLAGDPALDGLTGRAVDEAGRSSQSWAQDPTSLTRENLWNRAISFTIFLRAPLVARVGRFDEQLGLGAATLWASGEEIDYLVRALDAGARIAYDPALVVTHPDKRVSPTTLRSLGNRDGASVGYILRKHRYPKRMVGRMLIRPLGGALVALAQRDRAQAGFHFSTLRGRLQGYRS
ncbi:MAG: glycosyltransferase [Actinomycetota bacterium]|nr:glycosyltransferase [Actinomycetota bacterium]